ncbi:asl3889 [Nostoc sp. PCC 7120 = FACHB-418]|nr:asl3889 [Nostoc sp. PCC 7120 = FACHB-418]
MFYGLYLSVDSFISVINSSHTPLFYPKFKGFNPRLQLSLILNFELLRLVAIDTTKLNGVGLYAVQRFMTAKLGQSFINNVCG